VAHSDKTRDAGHQTVMQEILLRHKKNLSAVRSGQRLAQVAQSSCGVSIFRDIQNSAGHGLLKATPL